MNFLKIETIGSVVEPLTASGCGMMDSSVEVEVSVDDDEVDVEVDTESVEEATGIVEVASALPKSPSDGVDEAVSVVVSLVDVAVLVVVSTEGVEVDVVEVVA